MGAGCRGVFSRLQAGTLKVSFHQVPFPSFIKYHIISHTSPQLSIGILGTRGIPNRYGGFEECAEKLALGLVAKGHKVAVYNSHQHEHQAADWNGVQIIHAKDPEQRMGTAGQFIYDLNCINDARSRRYDIALHLGYTSSSVWWWRWPRNAVNLVNMDGLEWKRSKYSRKVQLFLKKAEALAAKHADALIADSLGIQQHLKSTYGKDSTFIAYGAKVFDTPDPAILEAYNVPPQGYHLLIARMEPENNIETIIRGYLLSGDERPLLIVGNTGNEFGTRLVSEYGHTPGLRFLQGIYDVSIIDNLRYYSQLYFHGHSVGGTNPSLLEAMGCHALIAAHRNIFNEAILGNEAFYFSDAAEVANIISNTSAKVNYTGMLAGNIGKIISSYNWPQIVDAYEAMMLLAVKNR